MRGGVVTVNENKIMEMVTESMKAQGKSAEEIAQMEICIQYLFNADFRKAVQDYVFEQTYETR